MSTIAEAEREMGIKRVSRGPADRRHLGLGLHPSFFGQSPTFPDMRERWALACKPIIGRLLAAVL